MKLLNYYILALVTSLCIAALPIDYADAQSRHSTSRTIGLGGGGTAYQDLYHANFINPANLRLNVEKRPKITIGLAGGIHTNAGGGLTNVSIYNDYLTTGRRIDAGTSNEMLGHWFGPSDENSQGLGVDAGVIPLGLVYRGNNWTGSLVSRTRVLANSDYSRGFAELFFNGLDSDLFSNSRAVNTRQELVFFNEISLGYARTLWTSPELLGFGRNAKLHIGIAPKLLMGINYFQGSLVSDLRVQRAEAGQNPEIQHNFIYQIESVGELSDQIAEFNRQQNMGNDPRFGDFVDFNSSDFTSFNGTSLGVDIGATLEMDLDDSFLPFGREKKLVIGLSITDIGSVSFSDKARQFTAGENFLWTGFNYDKEVIDNEFDGDDDAFFESVLRDSIGNDVYLNFLAQETSSFSRALPTMINLGGYLQAGRLAVMLDVGTGLNDRGTNSQSMHLALGTEYRLFNRIPFRTGFRTGGYSNTSYHVGTGVEFKNFEFTFGAASTSSAGSKGSSAGFAWSGLVIHI
ncbi:MAG: DUF5723 family protein [Balneolaceae bacterium]